jgi:hypothetical protein
VLPDPAWSKTERLGRDHWVRADTCDYSVHPRAIGRKVELRLDLEHLTVTCGGDVVASHPRSWARNDEITDPAHDQARRLLQSPQPSADADEVEVRDLSVYDRVTGVA